MLHLRREKKRKIRPIHFTKMTNVLMLKQIICSIIFTFLKTDYKPGE